MRHGGRSVETDDQSWKTSGQHGEDVKLLPMENSVLSNNLSYIFIVLIIIWEHNDIATMIQCAVRWIIQLCAQLWQG